MKITGSSITVDTLSHYRTSFDRLATTMQHISSGKMITAAQDSPAEFGIAQKFAFQIRATDSAKSNLSNAQSLISTTDAWLQNVQSMLQRMGELAVSSVDGSKTTADREVLDLEYQQLKAEISNVAKTARFNGQQIATKDQVMSYDPNKKTFVFSQLDGSEKYSLSQAFLSGMSAVNGLELAFSASKDYSLSNDGKYIFYVDGNNKLARYTIEDGSLARDSSNTADKNLGLDEEGALYVSRNVGGAYALTKQNIDTWSQDTSNLAGTEIADMASPRFEIYQNKVYYQNTAGEFVARNLSNTSDTTVLLRANTLTPALNTTAGKFAISADGSYVADEVTGQPGVVRVTNVHTQESATIDARTSDIKALTFATDSGKIFFNDGDNKAMRSIEFEPAARPMLNSIVDVMKQAGSQPLAGISLRGGSPRSDLSVHSGPEADQTSVVTVADVRLRTLGIAVGGIASIEAATKAQADVATAIQRVTMQRSVLGAQEQRLTHISSYLDAYDQSISQAQSRIVDVDLAAETAKMTEYSVQNQAATSIMAQANQLPQAILKLLNSRG